MWEPSIGQLTNWPGNWNEGETRIAAGSSQLHLFDQSAKPTQLELLAGSCAILTMALLTELKLKCVYLRFHMLLGPPTHTGWMGTYDGVSLYLTK